MNNTTNGWKQYKRKGLSEMRPYVEGEDVSHVSISEPDKVNGSPKAGDMIARNPKNHADQWLVAAKYFEDNVEPACGVGNFGVALEALKAGKRVARAGWNGKGMFLFLLPAGVGIPTKVIHDPALRAVIESEVGGETFDAHGSVRMFTADKKVLTGWMASQTDMLAEDWVILS